ncbi:uncharacterized protein LOC123988486 isoform X2 [Osmia bicornis bicornis]|uniref:uncharacterized protein LOC123988486 isoform X2 n=2 Tax=Osmia bicornis bicornis TaxID=1437191 RepID=UPI001EAF48A1|nr:uncharacterized protein LOC123988486 isoform X2 [Osmia bicornis bicornis]
MGNKFLSEKMAGVVLPWLNIDYANRIMRQAEEDNTLQVTNIFTKAATDKGDNYSSDLMRVTVDFTRNKGDKLVTEKKSMILKLEPLEEGPRREMVRKIEVFDTEISALTDAVKKMNHMLGPEERLCPKVYHVRKEPPVGLIMEDLSVLGFRMVNRQLGLDIDHALMALRGIARFHAASVALCDKEPKYKEQYRKGLFSRECPMEMQMFIGAIFTAMADEVEKWPEFGKPYADKLRAFAPNLYRKGGEVTARKDNEFNVINHGDCWVNNMLFRYDDNGKPIQHIFVDFQQCLNSSPALDLHYFMATSLSEEVYEHKRGLLLDEYLKTLTSVMKRLGCKTSPPTMDELQRTLKERQMFELIASALVLPITLLEKDKVMDVNELLQADCKDNPGHKSDAFRNVMSKRLPRYMEMGLLDP